MLVRQRHNTSYKCNVYRAEPATFSRGRQGLHTKCAILLLASYTHSCWALQIFLMSHHPLLPLCSLSILLPPILVPLTTNIHVLLSYHCLILHHHNLATRIDLELRPAPSRQQLGSAALTRLLQSSESLAQTQNYLQVWRPRGLLSPIPPNWRDLTSTSSPSSDLSSAHVSGSCVEGTSSHHNWP